MGPKLGKMPPVPSQMPTIPGQIDSQLLEDIISLAKKVAIDIPKSYAKEQARILKKMTKASPEPYEGLLLSEYPDKNLSKVNALALKNVTTGEAKKKISDDIYKEIEPKLEAKIADKDALTQKGVRKAVEKSIEKAVDKSVSAAIKQINTKDTPTQSENRTNDTSTKS